MKHVPYKQAMGYFMYTMIGTRPNINTFVGDLKSIYARTHIKTWESGQHILKYLQGSKEYWLHYFGIQNESNSEIIISGSCDFD
jgi:hypothetical protein